MSDVNQAHLKKLDALPEGWADSSVSQIVQMVSANNKKLAQKKYLEEGEFPVIDQGQDFIGGYSNDKDIVIQEEPPFIVFGDHTRAFKFANFQFVPGADGVKIMKPIGVDPKWCFYIFQAIKLPNKGYARHFQYLKEAYVPVPPAEQQKRIVAKIEELFSHIDAGIEALKKAKQLLKQYRQSVLNAAVNGELTKEWREANKGKQNSSKLLKEKLLELKVEHNKSLIARWEKAKEQWKLEGEIGKRPGKPKINDFLEEVYDEIIEELPPIPGEWCWIMLGDISDAIDPQPSHRTPSVVEGGIPYVGIGDVDKTNGNIDFENARQVSPDVLVEHKIRYDLKEGDFIIGKIGTIGKPFQIPTERFYTLSANVVLVRPIGELANPNYLFNLCKSPVVERQFESGSKATTQAAFGIKKVRLLAVPYCSLAEQVEIVKNLEDCLMRASRLEAELDRQIKMAEKNKKSVLASAFIGRLQ